MHKQTPGRFVMMIVSVAIVTWLLVLISCSFKRSHAPAKQQVTPQQTTIQNHPIAVDQIDTNQDGLISQSEASHIHQTNTTTPIVIFLCVGAATLASCVICVWAARRIPRKNEPENRNLSTSVDEDPDFLTSTPARSVRKARKAREPAAPQVKTERLRRSNDK
jgi:flagellar basal body-associated protein FliL